MTYVSCLWKVEGTSKGWGNQCDHTTMVGTHSTALQTLLNQTIVTKNAANIFPHEVKKAANIFPHDGKRLLYARPG